MGAEPQLHYYVLLLFTAQVASQLWDEFAITDSQTRITQLVFQWTLNLGLYLSCSCLFLFTVSVWLKIMECAMKIWQCKSLLHVGAEHSLFASQSPSRRTLGDACRWLEFFFHVETKKLWINRALRLIRLRTLESSLVLKLKQGTAKSG